MSTWTVVVRGDWYLPHLVNMLKQYTGNGEQTSCRDEVVAQIESQIITKSVVDKQTRPLVVIDPEDTSAMEALAKAWRDLGDAYLEPGPKAMSIPAYRMQAALREFADPKPPKPDEPTGLGAVVEDAEGLLWVRTDVCRGSTSASWSSENGSQSYADLDAVKVLSEGVTP